MINIVLCDDEPAIYPQFVIKMRSVLLLTPYSCSGCRYVTRIVNFY